MDPGPDRDGAAMAQPLEHTAAAAAAAAAAADARDAWDWAALRALSLQPRGFGKERRRIWPFVLNAQHIKHRTNAGHQDQETEPSAHKDERQIKLDTDRSFVLYPVDAERKDELKHDLNDVIVSLFRKRPKLHYFQGYHDIVSVLFLTLPSEVLIPAVEKMSLHRVRDSMGNGLEPMIGQLRIMKRLLRLADPELAAMVESTTPLPYYALSNLLTLFSHDVPTLPLIQHVFDYLLCRPPLASIYLGVAVIMSHSNSVRKLVEEGEEGMLHAVLTSFPPVEDESSTDAVLQKPPAPTSAEHDSSVNHGREETGNSWIQPSPPPSQVPLLDEIAVSGAASEGSTTDVAESESESAPLLSDSWTATSPPPRAESLVESIVEKHPESEADSLLGASREASASSDVADDSTDNASTLADDPIPREPARPLTDLLRVADDLLSRFPPSDPRLAIDRILGPQSAIFTWSEDRKDMPSDDDAEKMVDAPELVVRSDFVDEDELPPPRRAEKRPRPQSWWLSGSGRKGNAPSPATIVAGVVLAVSIGIAVYDVSRRAQGRKEL
ncbi:hypothetical protein EXIGLDRAFT_719411 [Exidia glandulosa HHB12029]|uniref:Rab-GAP TBC domain-containing protein n=1 Tax=Exidia glandulosa HHB12029 TaxID=1314781 RepID=A0A165H277_EXIGL|nr:hypothetical protein EXIGLDRAFT_719411 [Exidia glandulosa HHB12029]